MGRRLHACLPGTEAQVGVGAPTAQTAQFVLGLAVEGRFEVAQQGACAHRSAPEQRSPALVLADG